MAGNTALATPAASVAASPPPTRIVLRVALAGKPRLAAALLSPGLGAELRRPALVVADAAAGEPGRQRERGERGG